MNDECTQAACFKHIWNHIILLYTCNHIWYIYIYIYNSLCRCEGMHVFTEINFRFATANDLSNWLHRSIKHFQSSRHVS